MTRVHLCETHIGMSARWEQCGPEDMGATAFVEEGAGVRVKPLNFMRYDYGLLTEDARYIVAKTFDTWRVWFHSDPLRDGRGWPINYDDEWAAVSAANQHNTARILAALEPVAQPDTPTPGQFTAMCLAIEDVVTGRGFDVDPWRSVQDDPPPMDGTKFLAYAKHAQVLNGEFQLTECQFSQGWWGLSPAHNWPASFTHWQPLTKPGETTSAIPEEVKAYLRNALMVGGWRGERE